MSKRLSYDFVKSVFDENNCTLLSTEYKNNGDKLKYICSCGTTSECRFRDFKRGGRCRNCKIARMANSRRASVQDVKKEFENAGCILLSTEYKNTEIKLDYVCICGGQSKITLHEFRSGRRCLNCKRIKASKRWSGNNNPSWNPNREEIQLLATLRSKFRNAISCTLRATGQKKETKSRKLLGWGIQELQSHLESLPTWDSLKTTAWELDYGITDIKLINCLDNLQPLSRFENISKNGRYNSIEFEHWLTQRGYL